MHKRKKVLWEHKRNPLKKFSKNTSTKYGEDMQQTEKTLIRNRYKIEKVLDQGGFGIAYLAEDTSLCQKVVLKKYCFRESESGKKTTSHEKGKKDFLRETRILSSLSDVSAVVRVLDYFEEDGDAYIVMEYVIGITLRKYVENHIEPMNFEQAWEFLLPVINALEKVHEKNLIHRDVNPDNIIVWEDGTLKLIDFGSAREYEDDRTMTALVKGGYAPPEQYVRKGKQGPWTDVYSLCATIYEMITEVIPESALERQNGGKLYLPSSYGCEITPQQEETLMRGLSLDYKKRYQNVKQLKESLLSEEERDGSRRQTDGQKQKKLAKTVIAACIIIGIIFAGTAIVQNHKNNLHKAQEKVMQERSLPQYPRDSKEHLMVLNYLVKYGKYKGTTNEERNYVLPRWAVKKINVQCNNDFFPQKKGEYLSFLRRKGISLKLKGRWYRGDVYITPYAGTMETYFTCRETYEIEDNYYMNVIYDIATSKITRILFYRSNTKQQLDDLVPIAAQSIAFFSRDWNLPRKKTEQKIKELIGKYESEKQSETHYSWISVEDGNVGCRMKKGCGTMLEVFRYTGL